ncbi:YidB family protein [Cypionkella sp.]|nr:YidB family protein [Cypionkella sp.]
MTALLALLAVAGYQNRDRISDMLRKAGGPSDQPAAGIDGHNSQSMGNILSDIGSFFTGSNGAGALSGGLSGLIEQFRGNGHADTADSWVASGENKPIAAPDLEATLGEDTLAELQAKTGLSRETLLERLSRTIPEAVHGMTPDGRLPTEEDAKGYI